MRSRTGALARTCLGAVVASALAATPAAAQMRSGGAPSASESSSSESSVTVTRGGGRTSVSTSSRNASSRTEPGGSTAGGGKAGGGKAVADGIGTGLRRELADMFERLLQGRAGAASGFPEVPPALQAFHGNRMALRVFSDAADAVAVCRDVAPSLKQSIAQAQDLQARDFMRLTRQRIMESPLLEANERAALVADVDRNARSLSARYLGVGPRERTAFRDAALARTFGSGNAFDELKLRLRKQITNTTCLTPDARKAFDAAVRDMRGNDARALAEMAAAERIQTWYAARRSDPAEEVGELLMLSIAGEHCDWLSKRTRAAVDREALERAKIVAKARGLHHHEVLSAQREASYARYRQEGCGPAQRIAAERGFAMAAR